MPEKKDVNCINTQRLNDTIDAIKADSNMGDFRLRAHNEWVEGGHCFSVIKDFKHAGNEYTKRVKPFIADADEPDVLLGTDYGPNATEWALHALASCVNTTLVYHAAARNVRLNSLTFDLEGHLDLRGFLGLSAEVRPGYQSIKMDCKISGDASAEQLQELVGIGTGHSPVFDMISASVPVEVNIQIEPAQKAA